MRGRGEGFQHRDGTGPSRWWQRHIETVIPLVMFTGVAILSFLPLNSRTLRHQPPQWQLAFGATTYLLAIAASLLFGLVTKVSVVSLRVILGSLVLSLIVWPPLAGSMFIAVAVSRLAGYSMNGYEIVLGIPLGAVLAFLLLALARRTVVHG